MRKGGTDRPLGTVSAHSGLCVPGCQTVVQATAAPAGPGDLLNVGFLPRSSELEIVVGSGHLASKTPPGASNECYC